MSQSCDTLPTLTAVVQAANAIAYSPDHVAKVAQVFKRVGVTNEAWSAFNSWYQETAPSHLRRVDWSHHAWMEAQPATDEIVAWLMPDTSQTPPNGEAPLTSADLKRLETESWIDRDTAEAFQLRRVNSAEGAQLVGATDHEDYSGLVFPNFWPGNPDLRESYLRRDRPSMEVRNGKHRAVKKYVAPPGRSNLLLCGPHESREALSNVDVPILFLEGVKKVMAAWRLARHGTHTPRALALGVTGAWNWRGTVGKTSDEKGARIDVKGVIPDFDKITWRGRTVVVLYDSDTGTNDKVRAARRGLVAELEQRGAHVVAPDLPQFSNLDKTGFDDLLARWGPQAVRDWIEAHRPNKSRTGATTGRIHYRRATDIEPRPVRWLWKGKIARRKTMVIAGNPGLGKSTLVLDVAARVSKGGAMPVEGELCDVGNVVIISAEDDASDTIKPRLVAAGADLTHVYIVEAVTESVRLDNGETVRSFNLATDLCILRTMLEEIGGAALIIIDPISAYLGATDSHKNAEVRALLAPLADLAEEHDAAVVCISHLNKDAGREAILRITGSLAFVAAARAAFVVTKDPEQEGRRLFLPLKNNLAQDANGLAYAMESATIDGGAVGVIPTVRVVWAAEPVTLTAEEAMRPPILDDERSELAAAKEFLQDFLAKGARWVQELRAEAEGDGHSWATIRRAQLALRIKPDKEMGGKGRSFWSLPTKKTPNSPTTSPPGQGEQVVEGNPLNPAPSKDNHHVAQDAHLDPSETTWQGDEQVDGPSQEDVPSASHFFT